MEQIRAAILGSGNIGTDLMYKLMRSKNLRPTIMAGIIPDSEGLARARNQAWPSPPKESTDCLGKRAISISFSTPLRRAHKKHAPLLLDANKIAIDLTPAAVGPYIIPLVNLDEHIGANNVNLVSCGGQATVPLVSALHGLPRSSMPRSSLPSRVKAPARARGRTSTNSPIPPRVGWRKSAMPRTVRRSLF